MVKFCLVVTAMLTSVLQTSLPAQTITSAQNPASNILTGLPNYGIAQGSIFVLYGAGLGPAAISVAPSLPFLTALAGTSISVTSGGTVYSPFMIYTLTNQIAAVMPSSVPAGAATVQVTYNGATGAAFATTIVPSAFGISTLNTTGGAGAVLTYPTATAPFYAVVSKADSVKPGSTYTMWGTGLGAANKDNDLATNGDLGTPVQVWVGGLPAVVSYRGRSGAPGLDQINFTIPAGVTGCGVSLIVQTRNIVSNNTTIPVAAGGGACSDPMTPSNAGIAPALAKGSVVFGVVSLRQNLRPGSGQPPTVVASNSGAATFLRYTASAYSLLNPGTTPSNGSCTTQILNGTSAANAIGLDAGTAISVGQPDGTTTKLTVPFALLKGSYSGTPTSLAPGAYALSGTGGADAGGFSATLAVPAPLVWLNQTALAAAPIIRSQPVTVTWSGGDPNSYATITGTTLLGSSLSLTSTQVFFSCTAPISAGQFTVPASVLLALPPSPAGNLSVGSATNPVAFSATGVDVGYAAASSTFAATVSYQ